VCSSFGAEADVGGGVIILNGNIGEVGFEGLHVEGAERGEVLAHRGTEGFVVGRLSFATRDESKSQGTRRDGNFVKGLFHRDLGQNCSAIFVRAWTLIPVAFRACGGQTKTLLLPCVGLYLKSNFVHHRRNFRIGHEQFPDQARAVIFNHYSDGRLIQAHVDW